MAELIVSTPIASAQHNNGSVFQAFDDYGWDRDKNFLVGVLYVHHQSRSAKTQCEKGGLVLALGGYHALAQSASQADLVLHSRIFYYARITGGVTIPYSLYRGWLRHQCLASHEPPRLWEWHLLELMCSHRDRVCGTNTSDESTHTAAAEKALWIKDLLKDDDRAVPGLAAPDNIESHGTGHLTTAAPAWMAAAPREELYVHRRNAADGHGSDDLVPYPDKFGVIIRAIQTGEKIEGIVEIPDIVARNPVSGTKPRATRRRI